MDEAFHRVNGQLHCEAISATDLATGFGTPLYVYSRSVIEQRFETFRQAFSAVDPLIAYSVKANGNLSVLRILAGLGAGADIVSGGELVRALAAGIAPDRILFSGVGKTRPELEQALDAGILGFNVESEGELRLLSAVASSSGQTARIALRVNPDVQAETPHHYTMTGHGATKFGVPYVKAAALYRTAAELEGIEVCGADVHIGSQILDPVPYRDAVRRVLELIDGLAADGIDLDYFDIGGGYGVAYNGERTPDARDFADLLVPELRGRGLRIVLEPGRFIIGPAGILLTRVLYVKDMGSKTFVITDAGMNDLLRPSHYSSYHRIDHAQSPQDREDIEVDVVGPVCESGDFLGLDRRMARPEPGDLLAIGTVGAYGFAMASTYNSRPRPAEVIVHGSTVALARRRETVSELIEPELDPAATGSSTA